MICGLANSLWLAGCLPELARFRRATTHVREEQEKILFRFLRGESDFAKQHDFSSIKTIRDYQQAVPLRRYEDFQPWIDRIAAGEKNVLTPERVDLFEPTSGSSGATKLIPYTASLQREFQRGIRAWIADLFLHDPQLMLGPAYWSVSPPVARRKTDGGIPIGFDDDSAYVGGWQRRLVQKVTVKTPTSDVRLISIWNPTFLSLQADRLPALPNLRVISCWTDANAAAPATHLAKLFPHAKIQGKGLIATEGFISFPMNGHEGTALAIRSHFLEFIPLGSETALLADELDAGQQYAVVITTGGGLYRYQLDDVIEVAGRIGQCPLIRFVGRQGLVSDWFGEKLNEAFVAGVLRESLRNAPSFAMLACDTDIPAYVLYIDGDIPDEAAEDIDTRLRRAFHYDYARFLGQLQPLRICRVERGAEAYQQFCIRSGQQAGDIKPLALDRRNGWSRVFAKCDTNLSCRTTSSRKSTSDA
ncbi:MAG: GH3 auxin-responsive promoter family protein [Acidobacteriota bacterium]|nr:GH3 auxin-responsive promoter family protein [Acidobacteriota bacterium]